MKIYVTKGSCIILKGKPHYQGDEIELGSQQFERLEDKGKVSHDAPKAPKASKASKKEKAIEVEAEMVDKKVEEKEQEKVEEKKEEKEEKVEAEAPKSTKK